MFETSAHAVATGRLSPSALRRLGAVRGALHAARLEHCVFGSAAGHVYGFARPPRDVDVLVDAPSFARLRSVLPHAEPKGANGLQIGDIEVWQAPLVLEFEGRRHELPFDDEMRRRWLADPELGWVLSAEDELLLKASLRRRPGLPRHGAFLRPRGEHPAFGAHAKDDVADAFALLDRWRENLDWEYLLRRAVSIGVIDRLVSIAEAAR